MRWNILRVGAVIGLALLAISLLLIGKPFAHKLVVKSYFTDANGLRSGAAVRLAGVDLGSVTSVRVRPESKDAPVEIVMALKTGYELKIPNDSTVSLETAGVLGQTLVEIDSHAASGPPIQSGSTLKAQPTGNLTTEELIAKFATAFNLSTAEALEKLESRIKERCDDEKVQSGVTNKRPASRARAAN